MTGLSVALSVVLVGATSFAVTRWSLLDQLDRELVSVAQTAAGRIAASASAVDGVAPELLGSSDGVLTVVSAAGQVTRLPGQADTLLPGGDEIAVARVQSGSSARTVVANGVTYRAVSVPMVVKDRLYAVMYSRPTAALEATLGSLWLVMAAAGVCCKV